MKIGIIGLGNIGQMLAKRFVDFLKPGDIITFDKSKQRVRKP
jgi:pyrroline-5-carboxylate reductase